LALKKTYKNNREPQIKANDTIRASELRVIGPEGENFGVMKLKDALLAAKEAGTDLIEISPNANPPVAKIGDYGKFLYEQKKKKKLAKTKSSIVEVKSIQIKIGTDGNDLNIKAKKTSEWLLEGHRVKINLFLPGRTKYMDKGFLEERLERLLKLLPEEYKIAEPPKKSPKGLTMIIEKK